MGRLHSTGGFWILVGALLLAAPHTLMGWVLLACGIHELGHYLAIRALGGEVEVLRLTGLGAVMVFLAAAAIGRVSVRSVRDVRDVRVRDDERVRDTVTGDSAAHDDHTRAIPLHQPTSETRQATGPIMATEPDHTTVPTRRRGLKDRLFGSSKTPVSH